MSRRMIIPDTVIQSDRDLKQSLMMLNSSGIIDINQLISNVLER